MLTVLGSPRRCCDGLTRRETLKVGALSALGGFGLPQWLQAAEGGQLRDGKAKSVIVLYLLGGAATQDMFDLKSEAPVEVRSQFRPIASSVPGIEICEHLPQTATWMHKAAIVRTVNHKAGCHITLPSYTGYEVLLPDITGTKETSSQGASDRSFRNGSKSGCLVARRQWHRVGCCAIFGAKRLDSCSG